MLAVAAWRCTLPADAGLSLARCRPASSKLPGSSQASNAAFRAGHSLSMIEYQAVSRLRPL